jgi:hypothetical protein
MRSSAQELRAAERGAAPDDRVSPPPDVAFHDSGRGGRTRPINGRDASTGKAGIDLDGARSGRALAGNALASPG